MQYMYLREEVEKNYTKSIYVYFSMSIQPRFMYFGARAGWLLSISVVLHTMLLSLERFGCSHPFTWGSNSTLCAFLQSQIALSINLSVVMGCDCPASDQRSFPGILVLFSWKDGHGLVEQPDRLDAGPLWPQGVGEAVFRKKCLTSSPKKSFVSYSYWSKLGEVHVSCILVLSFVMV